MLVEPFCTTWLNAVEVLPPNDASPEYLAVIVCIPADSSAVPRLAVPPARVTVPMATVPSVKVTVPVGVPSDEEVTFAENVTPCP